MPSGFKSSQCFSTASKIKPKILSMSARTLLQDVPQPTSLASSHIILLLFLSNPTTLTFCALLSCPPPQGLCTCFSLCWSTLSPRSVNHAESPSEESYALLLWRTSSQLDSWANHSHVGLHGFPSEHLTQFVVVPSLM